MLKIFVYDSVCGNNHRMVYQISISIISLGSKSINQSIKYNVRTAYCILFENGE